MSKKVTKRTKKPSKLEQAVGINEFDTWLNAEAERTGRSKQKIVEETFQDGFLTWTIDDTQQIVGGKTKVSESAVSSAQAPPILTAWAMPNVAEDIDEIRRLRREFAPVSRAVDYIKGMILGNELDVEITDPEDKSKKDIREAIKKFMKDLYQDEYTRSLYTLVSIMLDESLTVGASGAEIRYETPVKFADYVDETAKSTLPVAKSTSGGSGKEFTYYKTHEPDWSDLKSIVQLKIFKNAKGRLKLYRDPETWEANYWTLDEIVSQGDTTMAMSQLALKPASGQVLKFHPWQLFWLVVNRREFDEQGMSVIMPVKNTALLLEKILNAVGEGCFRAGNKKYFIICGTEKRPWSKPSIRNTMQQINEMGKRNWTTVPVPYGFDIKEIGGNVFQANQVVTTLINLLAQGMHVPTEILGILTRAMGTTTGERTTSASFNEIEQMRYEFKMAIENQLFKKQLWCEYGKTKTKQGGKGIEAVYVPDLKCSTKGLLSPIDKLDQIIKLLNVANPVSPQMKLELEREMGNIMGYDNIDFETQEELKEELKKRVGTDTSIANPLMGKTQGEPAPQTQQRQQDRQAGGVNVKKAATGNAGGTRIPKETKKGVRETSEEATVEETSQTEEIRDQSSQKTGGNYGPQGYYQYFPHLQVMEIPNTSAEGDSFEIDGPIVDTKITVEIRKLKGFVAGYNEDLSKIYIDPEVDPVDFKPIIGREVFEFGLERVLNLSYEESEKMADVWEKYICDQLGIDWDEHQERCRASLKIVNGRKEKVSNPKDIVRFAKPKKATPDKKYKEKGDVTEVASEGQSSMRKETGNKEAQAGFQTKDVHETHETKTIDINVNVKSTEGMEKALEALRLKQDEINTKLNEKHDQLNKDILAKQDQLNTDTKKVRDELAGKEREKIMAEKAKIDMEIVNLETERKKIEAEIKAVEEKKAAEIKATEESAKNKKELLDKIEKKIRGEE